MRTLVVAGETPVPPNTGFRLRNFHLASQLATEFDVEFAALGPVPQVETRFRLIGVAEERSRRAALLGSLTTPYMAARQAVPALTSHAVAAAYDTVQAESPFVMAAALATGRPVVLDAHNVETELPRSLATADDRFPRRVRRARWRWEAWKTEAYERRMVQAATAVCATSADEAAVFVSWGAREVVVVPNGIDTIGVSYAPPKPSSRLLYVGTYGYLPNVVAAIELVDEVLPRTRRLVPAATVRLVGRDPGAELLQRASDAVEVTGTVPDVLPHLRSARALVVPLRAGGGTRLKVLEAMAAGLPVVSTRFGVSGLQVVDEEHVLLADTPEDLAVQCARIIEDQALATRLAENGRKLVEAQYDWTAVARPLIELHRRLGS